VGLLVQINMNNLFKKNKKRVCPPKPTRSRGFLTIEALIAICIIAGSILAAMSVAQKTISLSGKSLHHAQASFLLEEGAEATRITRDNTWANISNLSLNTNYYPTFSNGTWTLSPTSTSIGIFTRTVSLSAVNRDATSQDISVSGTLDSGTKLVTVTISWLEKGQSINKTLQFYIMNIF
jgi:Tfp pilus assembly protein PilV